MTAAIKKSGSWGWHIRVVEPNGCVAWTAWSPTRLGARHRARRMARKLGGWEKVT